MEQFFHEFTKAAGEKHIREKEPMWKHTTFRVGGEADFYAEPDSEKAIADIVSVCRSYQVPCFVLGNGSNLLVSDKGYRGAVINLSRRLNQIETKDGEIYVQAGALLSKTAHAAYEAGLTGMEFAAGIPGTVGGAVVMNAGAYGGEMSQILKRVTVLTKEGETKELSLSELELGYRHSCIPGREYIVLSAVIQLKPGEKEKIKAVMDELAARRKEKQPLEYPSAGSTFKRPAGYFAGKLIQDTGLSGFQIGGACVSEKHCGFVINRKDATASDIWELCRQVSARVKEKFGVDLEMEVKTLGEFHW